MLKRALGLFICFLLVLPAAYAQVTISGKVVDKETKAALDGASVQEKGTKTGVTTDKNGQFSIRVSS
ncbi:MAG: carboxypeptidase-like regulatory domain-containing protein, partial [Chitinophagaceae bacterium]|nr:carboxypeptidase-like regulatory domain-containing protein [Chitinophagaceae bacterium]